MIIVNLLVSPDVLVFDVKFCTSLEVITSCKLLEHSSVVGSIVAGDVPNLKYYEKYEQC